MYVRLILVKAFATLYKMVPYMLLVEIRVFWLLGVGDYEDLFLVVLVGCHVGAIH